METAGEGGAGDARGAGQCGELAVDAFLVHAGVAGLGGADAQLGGGDGAPGGEDAQERVAQLVCVAVIPAIRLRHGCP